MLLSRRTTLSTLQRLTALHTKQRSNVRSAIPKHEFVLTAASITAILSSLLPPWVTTNNYNDTVQNDDLPTVSSYRVTKDISAKSPSALRKFYKFLFTKSARKWKQFFSMRESETGPYFLTLNTEGKKPTLTLKYKTEENDDLVQGRSRSVPRVLKGALTRWRKWKLNRLAESMSDLFSDGSAILRPSIVNRGGVLLTPLQYAAENRMWDVLRVMITTTPPQLKTALPDPTTPLLKLACGPPTASKAQPQRILTQSDLLALILGLKTYLKAAGMDVPNTGYLEAIESKRGLQDNRLLDALYGAFRDAFPNDKSYKYQRHHPVFRETYPLPRILQKTLIQTPPHTAPFTASGYI